MNLPAPRTHWRWGICLIVFFATMIIYSDRQFLSLLKSTLANDIHWTDTQFADVNAWFWEPMRWECFSLAVSSTRWA